MKILSILILALSASYTYAGHHSEALWQAHGGQNVVSADYNYENITWDVDNPTVTGEVSFITNRLGLNYERGINDMLSAGLGLDYVSTSSGSGFDGSGINFVNVFFKGNVHAGFGHFHYGLDGRISIADQETDKNNDGNGSIGGHEIEPFIGLMMGDRKTMTYGAKLAYQFNMEKTSVDETSTPANETETEDGNIIKAQLFLEKTLTDKSLLGVSLSYSMQEFSTDKDTNADSGFETNVFKLTAYGAVDCGCEKMNLTFLPKVSLFMGEGESAGGLDIDTGAAYSMEFAVRKEF